MDTNRTELPLARTDDLIIKEVDDEVLVYDLRTDQAHCLNKTAALVWRNCDGQKSVDEIQDSLVGDARVRVDPSIVWLAIDQLQKFNLLERAPTRPQAFANLGRRQIMQALSVAAVALPVVFSIVAPTAALAGSFPPGTCCTNTSQCQPGSTCTGPPGPGCGPPNGKTCS